METGHDFQHPLFFFGDVAPCVKGASQILFGKMQTEFLCSQNGLKHPLFFWYGNRSLTDKDKTHPKTLIKTILQIPTLGRCVLKNPARTSFKWKVTFQHHERCEENLNLSQPGTSTSLADYHYMTPPLNDRLCQFGGSKKSPRKHRVLAKPLTCTKPIDWNEYNEKVCLSLLTILHTCNQLYVSQCSQSCHFLHRNRGQLCQCCESPTILHVHTAKVVLWANLLGIEKPSDLVPWATLRGIWCQQQRLQQHRC